MLSIHLHHLKVLVFLYTYWPRVEPSALLLLLFVGLLCQLSMIDGDDCGAVGGMNDWQGKRKFSERACPSGALSGADAT
jgi:hypothetical protein